MLQVSLVNGMSYAMNRDCLSFNPSYFVYECVQVSFFKYYDSREVFLYMISLLYLNISIQNLYRCGGQGYLSCNRFGTFIGLAHAAMTAEGDNSVLMQKVCTFVHDIHMY